MFLLFGAFIAGMLTVLAPCVLPLLPIIIGGSVSGENKDKKRPLIIAASLAVSLLVFTLLLKATTLLIDIPPQSIAYFSGGIIVALGLLTLFPGIYARITAKLGVEQKAQQVLGKGYNNKRKYLGPIVIGAALGPVFSSCSPVYAYILATVLPVNFTQAFSYIVFYILGLSLVLLLIGYFGQKFIRKIKFASNPKGWFQRSIAILFIVVGLMIITGYDKKFQTFVSTHTPFNFDAISAKFLPDSKNKTTSGDLFNIKSYQAPEFTGLEKEWINSKPLTIKELKDKVVLVDFWTYSCINCIRNNPYLEQWYKTYKDDGLVVIGVHAPEFSFEKNINNVKKGVKDQKISYPVALDNSFDTWNAYDNRSWPSSYLIDAEGDIRRVHEGEGKYKEEEQAIRQLLTENGAKLDGEMANNKVNAVPVSTEQTPETYLGLQRASNYVGLAPLGSRPVNGFTQARNVDKNEWTLGGKWEVSSQNIIAKGNSTLRFSVNAKDVYVVAGSEKSAQISLTLNGKAISSTGNAGSDVKDSKVTVGENKLYRLASFKKFTKDQMIELTVPDGVQLNVFTFGS